MDSPVAVVFAYNRPEYLTRCLDSLGGLQGLEHVAVVVSQDGDDAAVATVAQTAGDGPLRRAKSFDRWQRSGGERVPALGPSQGGHAWLAQHYKWALDKLFLSRGHSHVILIEDDMVFAPDFLLFFQATAGLLAADSTLWCVSSWNDNGFKDYATDAKALFRTSYFPGLGWMMRRELWLELGPKFPLEHWDHWMRLSTTHTGRDCVCPVLGRNFNIGERGANMDASTYGRVLGRMAVATAAVGDFGDLRGLMLPAYAEASRGRVRAAAEFDWRGKRREDAVAAAEGHPSKTALMLYLTEEYASLASLLDIFPAPRAHHRRLAVLRFRGVTFLLADRRGCPYLPAGMRVLASPTMAPLVARRSQPCAAACDAAGRSCSAPDFWFLNTCESLAAHFPCEAGCAMVIGPDIPNYVLEPTLSTYRQCLVTESTPSCEAAHPATARLCPCVDRPHVSA